MKKLTIGLLVLSLLATFSIVGFASSTASHDVSVSFSDFVLISVNNPGTAIVFTISGGTAGQLPANKTDSSKSLDYLALVGDLTTKIDAMIGTALPTKDGNNVYDLKVEATSVTAQYGNPGNSAGQITLGTTATGLITGIGNVATGTGGADLTYTLVFNKVPNPDTDGTTVAVTYTINDAA